VIIGIEGTTSTGKTILTTTLAHSQTLHGGVVVPCYHHCAPDPALLPKPDTTSAEEQLAALKILLSIESLRRVHVEAAVSRGLDVVVDRTVDTLLAHTHAVSRLHGFDVDEQARELISARTVIVADLVIYLVADIEVLRQRSRRRRGMPTIFYDPEFVTHFNAHFEQPFAARCHAIDANQRPEEVAEQALAIIERFRARAKAVAQ
jgi:dTMP kinase